MFRMTLSWRSDRDVNRYYLISYMQQIVSQDEQFVAFFMFLMYNMDVLNLEVFKMAISYNKLWKQLIDKNMTKTPNKVGFFEKY